MPIWPSPTLSSGFTYVSDSEPANPDEGETWYDTNANEAKVYDGVSWQRLTVTDHGEIGSVSAGQHRSDENIQSVVDGAVDADTVDGLHASDLGASQTQEKTLGGGTFSDSASNTSSAGYNASVGATYEVTVENPNKMAPVYGAEVSGSAAWSGDDLIELGIEYITGARETVWTGAAQNNTVSASFPGGYVARAYAVFEKQESSPSSHDITASISNVKTLLVAGHSHNI